MGGDGEINGYDVAGEEIVTQPEPEEDSDSDDE